MSRKQNRRGEGGLSRDVSRGSGHMEVRAMGYVLSPRGRAGLKPAPTVLAGLAAWNVAGGPQDRLLDEKLMVEGPVGLFLAPDVLHEGLKRGDVPGAGLETDD